MKKNARCEIEEVIKSCVMKIICVLYFSFHQLDTINTDAEMFDICLNKACSVFKNKPLLKQPIRLTPQQLKSPIFH